MHSETKSTAAVYLGIEGGGTRTVALLGDARGKIFQRGEAGPLNLKLSTDKQILATLRGFQERFNVRPMSVGVCLAGCRTAADRARILRLVARAWPRARCFAGNDLDSGLAAAFGPKGAGILVISGTGSCVIGRDARGKIARAGGWGHLLGDHGSGYWIALTGLRAAIREYDRHDRFNPRILRRLCLNSPEQLIEWIQQAGKDEIAALASEFIDGHGGLKLQAASFLAQDCHAVAQNLKLDKPVVALAGGVLLHHRRLASLITRRICAMVPGAKVKVLRRDPAEGALLVAMECGESSSMSLRDKTAERRQAESDETPLSYPAIVTLQITEQRNPRTMDLDKQSIARLIETMLAEEARVVPAVRKNKRAIEGCISAVVAAFRRGGRLFYIGAGTSGRIGVLDASECPPTFSTDPEMVQGIIAGGVAALHSAGEGAEDDALAGAEAIRNRGVGKRDVVVGITASGTTPYVLGALDEAKRRGAKTFLLCFSPPRSAGHPSLYFATGPEALTGSTRLKAGTATKIVLNMLTTIAMIRLGKVRSNLMVDVTPSNAKLRARACRIVAALCGCSEDEARKRLAQHRWNVGAVLNRDRKR